MAFISKRKNAKGETVWVIHYRVGKKQKMKTIGKTDKRTAQKALIKFENELANQNYSIRELKKTTSREYYREYFVFAEAEKATRTIEREKQVFGKFNEYFDDIYLDNILVKDLTSYRLKRLESVSEETVNLEFRTLKAIFNRAKEFGYLQENPFVSIKPIRVPESDLPKFFEIDEIKKVREIFADDQFEHLVEFYLLTGVRLREALSLTWVDIDLRRKQLLINSINTKGKKHRIIPFQEDKILENLIRNIPKRPDKLLFGPPDIHQSQWKPRWVSRRVSRILTQYGFPWASCHTFRHTYISHLVMEGVPLTTVQELVGHSDFKTTLRYAHLAPKHKIAMSAKRPY